MQYLVSVISAEPGLATTNEMAAIDAFNEDLRAKGHWVYANGLADPPTATVVDGRGEKPVLTSGPLVDSEQHPVGLWIVEAPNRDVAVELAVRASKACNRKVELRPFHHP